MPSVKISGPRTLENVTMPLGCNVLVAARRRIAHILDTFDSVVVAFSGGKDSLAALHLLREVKLSRGDQSPVDAIFRDEELIPDVVIDFVDEYRRCGWLNLKWFAVPLASTKYILGKTHDYVQWDPARPWVREKPSWGITEIPGFAGQTFDQYSMDAAVASYYPGKVCMLTGIRASESLTRYRAIVNKLSDPAVCATKSNRLMLGRPIYDWNENDVFKFFYEQKIRYCPIYDWQAANQENLRVSTPIHSECAKRIYQLKSRDPVFLDRILACFPEVGLQLGYWQSIDQKAVFASYPQTWEGVRQLIDEQVTDPHQHVMAMERYGTIKRMAARELNKNTYPIDYVMRYFLTGVFKRMLLPKAPK